MGKIGKKTYLCYPTPPLKNCPSIYNKSIFSHFSREGVGDIDILLSTIYLEGKQVRPFKSTIMNIYVVIYEES